MEPSAAFSGLQSRRQGTGNQWGEEEKFLIHIGPNVELHSLIIGFDDAKSKLCWVDFQWFPLSLSL